MLANLFPPLPAWDALHPFVVHLPIGILSVVPVLLVVAALHRGGKSPFAVAALLLMIVGSAAAYLAVATGEEQEERAEAVPAAHDVFEEHEESGERTALVFAALTGVYAFLLFLPALLKDRPGRVGRLAIHLVFLVLYLGGLALLANTGHLGGRLVHEFGVHAPIQP